MVSFDPIASDFNVTKISETRSGNFYAGLSGSLWHFVWASTTADNATDNLIHHSVNQFFIPRFLFAEELQRQLNFVSLTKKQPSGPGDSLAKESSEKNQVYSSGSIWGDFAVGVTQDDQIFLVNSEKGYAYGLGEASDWARDDLNLFECARTEVIREVDYYCLSVGSTNGGLPISHPSRRLIEAVAFERQVYGQLDPVNVFELFSAFCTLVDSPLSRDFGIDYVNLLISEQLSLSADDAPEWLEDLFMDLQDAIFDGRRFWGGEGTMQLKDSMPFVIGGFKKLSDVQRCQLVLFRDLHSSLPLISLAVVVGMPRVSRRPAGC